ncbi:N-acetylmuramidase domain-containing protein [Mesorhizobium sp. B2-5-11]|uniref:N-acetylmuramidase domain-containing protein n=1 Tax=Mesorhizobium sp. B2-5-11 TaxID=2589919 RepID=UPI0015E449F3|nr:N-acetylmuramidase domain-containing protein [Mesorhizobium sp. B2-5-11]
MDTLFKGAAVRLKDIDIPRIGAEIGVGEDELHAFMDVEAAGSGFDGAGRPKMLFEPHVFYRLLGKGAKRDAAVKAGLAYPKWGMKPYPKDSYPRLVKAMAVDEATALMAASWGLTQILGENHRDAGYTSPQALVTAFMASEANHLEATVRLLVAWKVDDDLRAHRWPVIARTWNGPGYKQNLYDTKMAAAFAKWQKIRDTPFAPSAAAGPAVAALSATIDTAASADKDTIERVQLQLKGLGYTEVGSVDGKVGTMTATAIRAFRAENGLPAADVIDDELLLALQKAKPRQIAPERSNAPADVVRDKVPEVKANWLSKVGGYIFGIPAAIGALVKPTLDNIPAAKEYIDPLTSIASDVPGWVWLAGVAGIAGALVLVARHGEQKGVEAFQTGARR